MGVGAQQSSSGKMLLWVAHPSFVSQLQRNLDDLSILGLLPTSMEVWEGEWQHDDKNQ